MSTSTIYTSLEIGSDNKATRICFWQDKEGKKEMDASLAISKGLASISWEQSDDSTPGGIPYTLQGVCLKPIPSVVGDPIYCADLTQIPGGEVRSAPGTDSRPPSGDFDPGRQNNFVDTWEEDTDGKWKKAPSTPFSKGSGTNGVSLNDDNPGSGQCYEYYLFVGWNSHYYVCDPQIYNRTGQS